MSIDQTYNVPWDTWKDMPSGGGGNNSGYLIYAVLPLHYNASTAKIYIDPASATLPGYVTMGAQDFVGPKTIISSASNVLTLQDSVSHIAANFGFDVPNTRLRITGPSGFDFTTVRPRSDFMGDFQEYISALDLTAPAATILSGCTITITGNFTFAVAVGSAQIADATASGNAKAVVSVGPFTGTDAVPSSFLTWLIADLSTSPPTLVQSQYAPTADQYSPNTGRRATIGVLWKTNGSSVLAGARNAARPPKIGWGARLTATMRPEITRCAYFGYEGGAVLDFIIRDLRIFDPWGDTMADTTQIIPQWKVNSIDLWEYIYADSGSAGRTRTTLYGTQIQPMVCGNLGNPVGLFGLAAANATVCLAVLYCPFQRKVLIYPSQAAATYSLEEMIFLGTRYVGAAAKIDGTADMLLIGTIFGLASDFPGNCSYQKHIGRQPWGSL